MSINGQFINSRQLGKQSRGDAGIPGPGPVPTAAQRAIDSGAVTETRADADGPDLHSCLTGCWILQVGQHASVSAGPHPLNQRCDGDVVYCLLSGLELTLSGRWEEAWGPGDLDRNESSPRAVGEGWTLAKACPVPVSWGGRRGVCALSPGSLRNRQQMYPTSPSPFTECLLMGSSAPQHGAVSPWCILMITPQSLSLLCVSLAAPAPP